MITAGNQNYVRRMALLNNESSKELVKKYNLPPGPASNKGIYEKLLLEGKLDAVENPNYVAPEETTYDIPRGWPKYPVFPDSGDVPGPPIQFEELVPDSVKAGYTFTDPNMIGEVDEYFYHGDHISSVVLVTDKKAKVVQQFAYMPFGELLVDNSTVDLDYRFSAKETDRESGLGYFGARYYDNTSAMWLGVDPLWEKNIGASPYNYCHGNPIMMVDPDGRDDYGLDDNGKIYLIGKTDSETDRLFSGYKVKRRAGVVYNKERSMELSKGIIKVDENGNDNNKYANGYMYEFGNDEELAKSFFEFCAKETSVEWAVTKEKTKDKGDISNVFTSRLARKEITGANYALRKVYGLIYHIHSHPDLYPTSEEIGTDNSIPSENDINAKNDIQRYFINLHSKPGAEKNAAVPEFSIYWIRKGEGTYKKF